jgi:hypothetical protein
MEKILLFLMVVFCLFFYSSRAFAYLDPGTGSMILQSILAAFLLISTGIGIFWRRIKKFFGRSKKKESKKM